MKISKKLLASLTLCPAILVASFASAQAPAPQIVRDRIPAVAPRPLAPAANVKLPSSLGSFFGELAVVIVGGDADPRLVSGGFVRSRGPLNGVLVPVNLGAYDR